MKKDKHQSLSPENYIRTRVRNLPIGDCFINDDWRDSGFAVVQVTREHINGNITHGAFMVDLYCLGVKESYWKFNQHPLDFKEIINRFKTEDANQFRTIKVSYALAHNIIYGAVEYAGEFGFTPHKSFELTRYILEKDDEHVKLIDIEFGFNGKPLYVASPENPGEKGRVFAHLEKNPGKGNYYFIMADQAEAFFDHEAEKERNKIDFQDPEIKRNLIGKFLANGNTRRNVKPGNKEKIFEQIEIADLIFYKYMATPEAIHQAAEIIANLFNFTISDERLSDKMLFGDSTSSENKNQVRKEANRLLLLMEDEKIDLGLQEAESLIIRYPEVPIFQYLMLQFSQIKSGTRKHLSVYRHYAEEYPGYLPFAYLLKSAELLESQAIPEMDFPGHLHLKNFYAGQTIFCREEVLLYYHLLILHYGFTGEIMMVEMLLVFMEEHHYGLMTASEAYTTKIVKFPAVMEWCEAWQREQEEAGSPSTGNPE